jgi:hypothetical protein
VIIGAKSSESSSLFDFEQYGNYSLRDQCAGADAACRLRGLRTNSPLQFGQTYFIACVHAGQKVHSNVQMNASPVGPSGVWHFSQAVLISSAISTQPSLDAQCF